MTNDARSGRGYEYGGPAFPGGILVGIGLGIHAWPTGSGFEHVYEERLRIAMARQ